MSYKILFSTKAKTQLAKNPEAERILKKLNSIRHNPYAYLKKLQGNAFWRLRVGKYRVILDVIVKGKKLYVVRVGKRDNVY